MPPKRKTASSSSTIAPRSVKVRKQKAETAQKRSIAIEQLKWFKKYADKDQPDLISPEGCQALFADLGVSLESLLPIIVGWKFEASRMGHFTKDEWINALAKYDITTVDTFKTAIAEWEKTVNEEPVEFKQLYLFTFNYVKTTGQKSMDVETATTLWQLMLQKKYPLIESFVQFLQEKKPVKVINRDQWSSLLDFCRSIPKDLSTYDTTSSWPVLFDDFVEWKQQC